MSDIDHIVIETEIVLAALRNHPGKSLSGAELQTMAGVTERQVRAAISALRRGGWLIVGDWGGYRFARNMADVEEIVRRLEEQAKSLQETAHVMRVTASALL